MDEEHDYFDIEVEFDPHNENALLNLYVPISIDYHLWYDNVRNFLERYRYSESGKYRLAFSTKTLAILAITKYKAAVDTGVIV